MNDRTADNVSSGTSPAMAECRYDVFLSHASADKPIITAIAERLSTLGLRPFLDAWHLVPGTPWQEALERALDESATMAVFIGPGGFGPMETEEMRAAIDERTRRHEFRVIPVLLPGASSDLQALPKFLRRFTWCDLRAGVDEAGAWSRLVAGIRGEAPRDEFARDQATGRTNERPRRTNVELNIARATRALAAAPYLWTRRSLTDEIERHLRVPSLPVLLRGLPGSGKTSVLAAVAKQCGPRFPVVLALRCRGPAAVEPAYVIEEINRLLNDAGSGRDPDALWRDERELVLREQVDALDELGALVVVDDFDVAPPLVQQAVSGLTGGNGARLVATVAREAPDELPHHPVSVGLLAPEESVDFATHLQQLFDLDIDPVILLDRLPREVRSHPRALATLMMQLRELPLELLLVDGVSLSSADLQLIQQGVESVAPDDRSALAMVEAIGTFPLAAASARLGIQVPRGIAASIGRLVARSLVQRVDDALEVPAAVGDALESTSPGLRSRVASEVVPRIVATCGTDNADVDEPVGAAVAHLAVHLATLGEPTLVAQLAAPGLLDALNHRGFWKEYVVVTRLAAAASTQTNSWSRAIELLFRLARKLPQLGDLAAANEALGQAEELVAAHGEPLERAELHSHRALLALIEGDEQTALTELHASRSIRVAAGDNDGIIVVDKLVGNVHLRRRDYASARVAYEAALALPFGAHAVTHRMEVEASLALCDLAEGRTREAEVSLRALIEKMRSAGYDSGVPRALFQLALVVEASDATEALALAKESAATSSDIDVREAANMLAWRLERYSGARDEG